MTINADTLSDVLRMMGHDVITTYNGTEAITAGATFQPDVYVLDLGMPGLNGYDTCRQIRASESGKSVSIVALSGWGRREDLEKAVAAGFSGFLLKPASPVELVSLFARWTPM